MEEEIVRWIHYDNKLKEYNEKSKQLRTHKDALSEKIFTYYEIDDTNKDKHPEFNVPPLKTKLTVQTTTHYDSLNYKFLTTCLTDYFSSEEKANDIMKYIKRQRSKETKLSLKRISSDS